MVSSIAKSSIQLLQQGDRLSIGIVVGSLHMTAHLALVKR